MSDNNYSILFVDDDLMMRNILSRTLGQIDYFKLYTAENSDEAIEKCSSDIDLVLLDIHLGETGTDGLSVATHLRKKKYDGIICMFTGDASPTLLFQAVLAGANDYILKGPKCNIVEEVTRMIEHGKNTDDSTSRSADIAIEDSAYLRTLGLSINETQLLGYFVDCGYPRIKEFALQLDIAETCLWKRLARIRDKLRMDSTAQIAHLLTSISLLDARNGRSRPSRIPPKFFDSEER